MKRDEPHRLSKFALMIAGARHDQSSEAKQAKKLELFRSRDGNVFADVYESAIRKTWPVKSRQFSHLLARRYFEVENKIERQARRSSIKSRRKHRFIPPNARFPTA